MGDQFFNACIQEVVSEFSIRELDHCNLLNSNFALQTQKIQNAWLLFFKMLVVQVPVPIYKLCGNLVGWRTLVDVSHHTGHGFSWIITYHIWEGPEYPQSFSKLHPNWELDQLEVYKTDQPWVLRIAQTWSLLGSSKLSRKLQSLIGLGIQALMEPQQGVGATANRWWKFKLIHKPKN